MKLSRSKSMFNIFALFTLLAMLFGLWPVPHAQAEASGFDHLPDQTTSVAKIWVVTNVNDSGTGSLRQAIADAANGDTITFDLSLAGQTILLSTTITIDKSITIDGTNLNTHIKISGSGSAMIFSISVNSFTIKDLNIIDGGHTGIIVHYGTTNAINVDFTNNSNIGSYGGAIWNHGTNGTINVTNCLFSGNSSGDGGAIYNEGTITINNSVFTNNSSSRSGGAIYNTNQMVINESTFFGNNSSWSGGAIYSRVGVDIAYARITGSTIFENSAGFGGGGIFNEGSSGPQSAANSLTISNTTIEGNINTGITSSGGFLIVKNSTIVNNTRSVSGATGSGLNNFDSTVSISNSIFANNTNGTDCYNEGSVSYLVNIGNLIENNGTCSAPAITADPLLGPLGNNGGLTMTMALLPGSPAIDAGDDVNCLATDQRGVTRPQNTHCDIGSYEKGPAFLDVPFAYWANTFIERLYNAGITGGCSLSPLMYCPETDVNRAQMAVFLLRGEHGSAYVPPAVGTGTGFTDVPADYWAAAWIKQLALEGITSGCGPNLYCPETSVTRDQMAVFLLRAEHGASYSPPPATGVFTDVPTTHWAAPWIEQLAAEGITGGCGADTYCPSTPVTRAQMAVFLVRTFSLP